MVWLCDGVKATRSAVYFELGTLILSRQVMCCVIPPGGARWRQPWSPASYAIMRLNSRYSRPSLSVQYSTLTLYYKIGFGLDHFAQLWANVSVLSTFKADKAKLWYSVDCCCMLSQWAVSNSLQPQELHARLPCPSPSQILLKLISIGSVIPSDHLIFYHHLLLLPSIFPRIRVFSIESALCIRCPIKYIST